MSEAKPTPGPCPFCGHVGLDFAEGSTFRWIVASCGGCGASLDETRIQTLGEGTKDEWMAEAKADAIAAWNRRSDPLVERVKELEEALRKYEDVRDDMFTFFMSNGIFNQWGKRYDCSALNNAHLQARAALSKARPNTAEGEAK